MKKREKKYKIINISVSARSGRENDEEYLDVVCYVYSSP